MYPHETPRKTGTQHVSKTLGEAWEACVFVVQSKLLKDLLDSGCFVGNGAYSTVFPISSPIIVSSPIIPNSSQ